jgi:hypothetical protein
LSKQFSSRRKNLEEFPVDDSTTKTIHYLQTNGTIVDDENFDLPKQPNGYLNGHIDVKENGHGPDLLHPSSAERRDKKRGSSGMNHGMQTRLRSRKSQAGV